MWWIKRDSPDLSLLRSSCGSDASISWHCQWFCKLIMRWICSGCCFFHWLSKRWWRYLRPAPIDVMGKCRVFYLILPSPCPRTQFYLNSSSSPPLNRLNRRHCLSSFYSRNQIAHLVSGNCGSKTLSLFCCWLLQTHFRISAFCLVWGWWPSDRVMPVEMKLNGLLVYSLRFVVNV